VLQPRESRLHRGTEHILVGWVGGIGDLQHHVLGFGRRVGQQNRGPREVIAAGAHERGYGGDRGRPATGADAGQVAPAVSTI
jgi:hypothetical protein